MGIIQRQGSINTVLTYLGFGIGFLNVIILYPRLLTQEQFGLTRLFMELGDITSGIILFGVPSVIIRFFPYYKRNRDKDMLFLSLAFCTITLILGFGIIFSFRDYILSKYASQSALFAQYYYLIFVLIFFNVYLQIFNHYTIANEKTIITAVGQQLMSRLFPMILLLFVLIDLIDFKLFIHLFALNTFVQLVVLLVYMKRNNILTFSFKLSLTTKKYLNPMIVYGLSIYIVIVVETLAWSIQAVTISLVHGISSTAIFTVASYVAQIIQIPQRSIALIALPVFSKSWAVRDFETINMVYKKSSLNLTIIGVFLFLVININLESIFYIVGQNYSGGIKVCMLMALAYIIDLSFGLNNEIITTSKYWRFNSITHIFFLLLLIPTNYFFIRHFGIIGAAYSLILSLSLYNTWRMLFLYKKHQLFPFSKTNFIIILYGIGLLLLIRYVFSVFVDTNSNLFSHFVSIALKTVVAVLFYLVPVYYLKISEDLNSMVDKMLKRIKG
jgi:O-antigen/teichoic acid export membrane protein